ncbi:MAG: hypothetical protein N2748_03840 [candidate division WOR-3 bacterium]|nr:hypothetical protein [candidate division WOR-3 bacterium]
MLSLFFITANAEIGWNGYLQTDDRLLMKNWLLSWQEYRLSLQTDYKPNDNIHFFSEIWLRSFGFSDVSTSNDLNNRQKLAPVEFDLREVYLDLYGLLSKDLDIRIGRQRIAWGVADKLNPIDNLNPNDLEDLWDFGRHLASNSIKVSYYIGNSSLTGVFIPIFSPAVLPKGNWSTAFNSTMFLPQGFICRSLTDTIIIPDRTIKQSAIYGVKVNHNFFNYDVSLSYVFGRYDLPLLNRLTVIPATNPYEVDVKLQFVYPRTHIFGFDVAGAIKNVGVWAEVGMYLPEKTYLTTDMTGLGLSSFDTLILDNQPYCRYIWGLDYTFANGIYINLQYLRGFVTERSKDNLHDYFMLGIDWKLCQEKLKISPLNGALEIKKWHDIKNNYAVVFMPEISYKPFDNTELSFGLRWIDGNLLTTFGQLKENDEVFLKMKYHF